MGGRQEDHTFDSREGLDEQAAFEDLTTLNIEPAEHYPAATDHVEPMIALIAKLMEKGFAYRIDDGNRYCFTGALKWPVSTKSC